MTPFGKSVASELRSTIEPLETASIVDCAHLGTTSRALLRNALFYVVPTPAIELAREQAQAAAERLAATIGSEAGRPRGISLAVDGARADAIVAVQTLIDAVADAEPTQAAKTLGIG